LPVIVVASHPGDVVSTRKPLTWPVLVRARPHDDHVGDRAVADPALGAVEHPAVAVAAGTGLERDRVRAVVGLGQGERADGVEPCHRGQPALLLRLGSEQVDRLHREARLHPEECPQAAVAAVQLNVDEAARERAHAGTSVPDDVLTIEAELGDPAHERQGQVGRLPVLVDRRQHLLVDEAAGGDEVLPLLVGELVADLEVVGRERLAEVRVGRDGVVIGIVPLRMRGRRCRGPWRWP
jgi:hypothetical protein